MELDRLAQSATPRWNADPDEVRKSVLKLVLTLVEFIRQILERQAIRRMDANTLTAEETEAVGLALMRLEETIRDALKRSDIVITTGGLGPTLDDVMSRAWEGLVTGLPAACPVCRGEVVASFAGSVHGSCSSCGTTIE